MRMFYFTCHCVCVGSRFEQFHPQPLKYLVSTATHLAHIILSVFLWNPLTAFTGSNSIATSTLKRVARALRFLLESNQMASQSQLIFFCTCAVFYHIISLHGHGDRSARPCAQLKGNSVYECGNVKSPLWRVILKVFFLHEQYKKKTALRNFVLTVYYIYIIREYTMNPFSKLCFWLVLNHYDTPIISVYIWTI